MALSETVNFWPFWKSSPKIETFSPADIQMIEEGIFQKDPTTVSIVYTPPTESSFKTSNSLDETKNNILKNKLLSKILKTSIIALAILGFTLLSSAFITFTAIKGISIIILPKFVICTIAAAAAVSAYLKAQKETVEDASNVQPQDSTAPISSSDQSEKTIPQPTDLAHLNAQTETIEDVSNVHHQNSTAPISSSDQSEKTIPQPTDLASLNAQTETTENASNVDRQNSTAPISSSDPSDDLSEKTITQSAVDTASNLQPQDDSFAPIAPVSSCNVPSYLASFRSFLINAQNNTTVQSTRDLQPSTVNQSSAQTFSFNLGKDDYLYSSYTHVRKKPIAQPIRTLPSLTINQIDNMDLGCTLKSDDDLIAHFKNAHGI